MFEFVYFKLVEEIVVIASTWFTPTSEPKEHGVKPSETTKQTVKDIWALLESTNQEFASGVERAKTSPHAFPRAAEQQRQVAKSKTTRRRDKLQVRVTTKNEIIRSP